MAILAVPIFYQWAGRPYIWKHVHLITKVKIVLNDYKLYSLRRMCSGQNVEFIQKVLGALLKQGKARLPLKCSSLLHSRPPSLPHPTFNLLRALHRPQAPAITLYSSMWDVREAPTKKKMFSFGHCPKRGGGDPCPNFLTLFFHLVVPYILTSISRYVILFGHFLH